MVGDTVGTFIGNGAEPADFVIEVDVLPIGGLWTWVVVPVVADPVLSPPTERTDGAFLKAGEAAAAVKEKRLPSLCFCLLSILFNSCKVNDMREVRTIAFG